MTSAIDPTEIGIIHLLHLSFGAKPALLRTLPAPPRLAFVHGTDLLYAERYPAQLDILQQSARAADSIVVPTNAMADRLLKLSPKTSRRKIEQAPWGIPDNLFGHPPTRAGHRATSHLRLLYAGRLTEEKGIESLLHAIPLAPAFELSIAAPSAQFHALTPLIRRLGVHVHYLG